jgi:hypothetical protein
MATLVIGDVTLDGLSFTRKQQIQRKLGLRKKCPEEVHKLGNKLRNVPLSNFIFKNFGPFTYQRKI